MENIITSDNKFLSNEYNYETILNIKRKYEKSDLAETSYAFTTEEGKNFFRYLKNFNLAKDPDLLILPHSNHYYFDEKELKNIRTLVNLKNLNLIKDLNSFLYTLIRVLPQDANFLGYFSYSKFTLSGDGLFSELSTRINNLLDLKTDHNMDKKEFTGRLRKFGFRIIDMTEMEGQIYFYAQKANNSSRLSA
jgi:hypothetical protein